MYNFHVSCLYNILLPYLFWLSTLLTVFWKQINSLPDCYYLRLLHYKSSIIWEQYLGGNCSSFSVKSCLLWKELELFYCCVSLVKYFQYYAPITRSLPSKGMLLKKASTVSACCCFRKPWQNWLLYNKCRNAKTVTVHL